MPPTKHNPASLTLRQYWESYYRDHPDDIRRMLVSVQMNLHAAERAYLDGHIVKSKRHTMDAWNAVGVLQNTVSRRHMEV